MDEMSSKFSARTSAVSQLIRRLRYQGVAQWITLILVASCVGLFMFTSSFNSALNRRQLIPAPSDQEVGAEAENVLAPVREDAAGDVIKADDLPADIVEEPIPEFTGPNFWDGVDWDDPLELPDKIAGSVFEMTVETGEEDIELKNAKGDIQVLTVFFRESIPKTKSKMDILLLHGSRFNSESWITVDTTKTFAAMGYRATAIDLPGFGNSAGQVMFGESAAQFIEAFCQAHGMKNPVIVAPSMAGGYALPYLMTRPYNVTALVALAPTSTERYEPSAYIKIQVPILTVYGTKDATFGSQVQRRLGVAPNSQTKLIQDAHHATYLDQPDEWHRIAYIFFRRLDAWAEKYLKSGQTTTAHPPAVTHSLGEILPPEVTLPALNVPPVRKFINVNGFDEVPRGTPAPYPQAEVGGTMADLYGQVSSINGKPVTPEEAAKIVAAYEKSASGSEEIVQLTTAATALVNQPQIAQTMSDPQKQYLQMLNQPGAVPAGPTGPRFYPQGNPVGGLPIQTYQNVNPGSAPVPGGVPTHQGFQRTQSGAMVQIFPPYGGAYDPSVPQPQALPNPQPVGPPSQPGYAVVNQPQNGAYQGPVVGIYQPPIGPPQNTVVMPGRFLNYPQQSLHSNGPPLRSSQASQAAPVIATGSMPFQTNNGRLAGQAAEDQLKALQAAQRSQLNQPQMPDFRQMAEQRRSLNGALDPAAQARLHQMAHVEDDDDAPAMGLQGLKLEQAGTTETATLKPRE